MFSDTDPDSVGFSSNWKFSRHCEESCVQTTEISRNDKDVQTQDYQPIGVQTEVTEVKSATSAMYDENRLAAFLGRICPNVIKELDRVSRSNAFSSYSLTGEVEEEVKGVLTLASRSAEAMKVSDLSWSCTGSVLAIAHSHTLHTTWCSHQGHVALYNIDRESKIPSHTLDAASCVRSVSMHPYLSSIVAAGTFSGEVLVWDISREDSEATLVNATRTSHDDSVTQVSWVLGAGTAVTLVSAGLDGHLIFWKVSPQLSSYQVLERYCCDLSSTVPGVTCFAFPNHKQDTFVVALEGGALLHCSSATAKPIAAVERREAMKDPVISSFELQQATVTSVAFSPHHDDVFATVSTDLAIRIYSLFQLCAQTVIWSVGSQVGVGWCLTQANVLAGWGDSNAVTLYNSLTGDTITSLTPGDTEHKSYLSATAFNSKSPRLMAVGDLNGAAHIWEIPLNFQMKPKHL